MCITPYLLHREGPGDEATSRAVIIRDEFQSVLPYSRKYWRELNLAVGLQIAIAKILADLNLAVR